MHPCTLPRLSDPVQSPSGVILFDSVPGRSDGLFHKRANVILTFGNYEREINSCSLGRGRLAMNRLVEDHNSGDFNWPAKTRKYWWGRLRAPPFNYILLLFSKSHQAAQCGVALTNVPATIAIRSIENDCVTLQHFAVAVPAFRTTWRPVLVQYLVVPWVPHRCYRRRWDRPEEYPQPSFRHRDK